MRITSIFLLVILTVSCAGNKDLLRNYEVPESEALTGIVYDDNLELEVSFIGVIADRYVFETILSNTSSLDIKVDRSQFAIVHEGVRNSHTAGLEVTIIEIEKEQKKLAKRRKVNNVLSGISAGIGLLSSISTGASASATIASSLESTLYIVDENTWISRDIKSAEDYISYLQSAQYDYDVIAPGASLSRDVFFDFFEINEDIEIEFRAEDMMYSVSFPHMTFNR